MNHVHNSYYDIDGKVWCEDDDCGEYLGTWSWSEVE